MLSSSSTTRMEAGMLAGAFGAGGPTRTGDLLITNQLLYQLSYTSAGRAKLYAPGLLGSGRRIAAFPALKRIAGVGRWVHSMQQTVFAIKRVGVAHAIAPFDPGSIECPQLRRTGHQRVALVDLEHDRLRRLHSVLAGNHETFGCSARFALAENLRACEHENSR